MVDRKVGPARSITINSRMVAIPIGPIPSQMTEIIQHVSDNTASFAQVNEGMRDQSTGADQINEAMGQLTANATQITQAAQEYARAAEDLRDAASSLKGTIAFFQVRSGSSS